MSDGIDYVSGRGERSSGVVYVIGEGVVDREKREAEKRLARIRGELPVVLGYPLSEILRQRKLFGDN